jgi:hypothetical protein
MHEKSRAVPGFLLQSRLRQGHVPTALPGDALKSVVRATASVSSGLLHAARASTPADRVARRDQDARIGDYCVVPVVPPVEPVEPVEPVVPVVLPVVLPIEPEAAPMEPEAVEPMSVLLLVPVPAPMEVPLPVVVSVEPVVPIEPLAVLLVLSLGVVVVDGIVLEVDVEVSVEDVADSSFLPQALSDRAAIRARAAAWAIGDLIIRNSLGFRFE